MARLRNHEKYGQSVNCKNYSPFGGNGPSFTVHLFATGETNEETQATVCAFEVWQREANKGKRTLVCSGEGFETTDPKSENTMIQLAGLIRDLLPAGNDESRYFHENYAAVLVSESKERTRRTNTKRKIIEAVPNVEGTECEPASVAQYIEIPPVLQELAEA